MPSRRFRLFVAADVRATSTDILSEFALPALNEGMVYFCSWGPGCERFHDIVDELVVEDSLREPKFSGPGRNDAIMTTWHESETLEEALEFFRTCAVPTNGFLADSDFGIVMCVGNATWAETASRFFERDASNPPT